MKGNPQINEADGAVTLTRGSACANNSRVRREHDIQSVDRLLADYMHGDYEARRQTSEHDRRGYGTRLFIRPAMIRPRRYIQLQSS